MGGCVAILGLAVLIGWYTHSVSLDPVHPFLASMPVNTALSFLLCGLSLVALVTGRVHLVTIGSLLVSAIGLLTLCEYMLGVDLGLDQLVRRAPSTINTLYPGRMAPQTALCFLLTGITLPIICKPRRSEFARLVPGLLGAMVFAFGLLACFGYITGWQTAYSWKPYTEMAVHTAVGFVMLSLGAMNYTWRPYLTEVPDIVPRLSIMAGVGLIVITLGLWQALLVNENKRIHNTVALAATNLQTEIVAQVNSRIEELVYVTARWESRESFPPLPVLENDVMRLQQRDPYLRSIMWVDPAWSVRWLQSREDDQRLQGGSLVTTAQQRHILDLAHDSREVMITHTLEGIQSGGLQIIVPLFPGANFGGFLISSIMGKAVKLPPPISSES
jgi:hypothetical protein